MNGEANQEKPPLLLPAATAAAVSGAGDRLKRDEWSEGAVSSLLEAYEAKWVLRNRAKLKGQDWEDVARHVSSRANQTKSPKTQTQCKNKIESMKKRYRSESAAAEGSSWPLYPRLDHLLRGNAAVPPPPPPPPQQQPQVVQPLNSTAPLLLLEPSPSPSPARAQPPPPQLPVPPETIQMSNGSNGIGRIAKEDGVKPKFSEQSPETAMEMETDSSTPAMYRDSSNNDNNNNAKMKPRKAKSKKRPKEEKEIAGSIRWLGKVVMRSERARMETMKEIEKMRAEAETKRGEIDLKRTEIIANTQLEIAKIFAVAASGHSKGIDSSLRIGRN
ncbi:PREDICTED: trihelix transcription factor ASIL2 [Tarenaya hassleriana]|uniref:trihelix transcription factor ASIL2 n=1 Tax=Tarenaya hassleriana TaxID=28532 RepID=UPI00053C7C0E|nr:PREDICTED: trihelix transcription factor ASIL2 [Tarenaya hassleriana]